MFCKGALVLLARETSSCEPGTFMQRMSVAGTRECEEGRWEPGERAGVGGEGKAVTRGMW